MACPHIVSYVACVVDYSLANNQIAKALIVVARIHTRVTLTTETP